VSLYIEARFYGQCARALVVLINTQARICMLIYRCTKPHHTHTNTRASWDSKTFNWWYAAFGSSFTNCI